MTEDERIDRLIEYIKMPINHKKSQNFFVDLCATEKRLGIPRPPVDPPVPEWLKRLHAQEPHFGRIGNQTLLLYIAFAVCYAGGVFLVRIGNIQGNLLIAQMAVPPILFSIGLICVVYPALLIEFVWRILASVFVAKRA